MGPYFLAFPVMAKRHRSNQKRSAPTSSSRAFRMRTLVHGPRRWREVVHAEPSVTIACWEFAGRGREELGNKGRKAAIQFPYIENSSACPIDTTLRKEERRRDSGRQGGNSRSDVLGFEDDAPFILLGIILQDSHLKKRSTGEPLKASDDPINERSHPVSSPQLPPERPLQLRVGRVTDHLHVE